MSTDLPGVYSYDASRGFSGYNTKDYQAQLTSLQQSCQNQKVEEGLTSAIRSIENRTDAVMKAVDELLSAFSLDKNYPPQQTPDKEGPVIPLTDVLIRQAIRLDEARINLSKLIQHVTG